MQEINESKLLGVLTEIKDELRKRREMEKEHFEINLESYNESREEWRENNKHLNDARMNQIVLVIIIVIISFMCGLTVQTIFPAIL